MPTFSFINAVHIKLIFTATVRRPYLASWGYHQPSLYCSICNYVNAFTSEELLTLNRFHNLMFAVITSLSPLHLHLYLESFGYISTSVCK